MTKIMSMLKRFACDPAARFGYLAKLGLFNHMSDEQYIKKKYQLIMGKKLDLDEPKNFNEKLQWLKLYDRKPEYTIMVDKYLVRGYIAKKLGGKYLIPLLGAWDDPNEIDFKALPNQFVLKCNHNSGRGMYICQDKSKLNIKKVKKELDKGMKENYYMINREWQYKNVSRKIICEKYMKDEVDAAGLSDYKVMCFEGKAKLIELIRGRYSNPSQDFYDCDWNKTEIWENDIPPSDVIVERPCFLEEMLELSEKLAEGIHHVRVDWYYSDNQLYFGELTFFDGAGYEKIYPEKYGEVLGSWIHL